MRDNLQNAKLVVVKVGSKILLQEDGRPNYPQIAHLVEQIATLHKKGRKIVFVSSGAIGAGMEALSLKKRPSDLPTLQAAAAVGQLRLMRAYEDLFGSFGCLVAQVLLTQDDLNNRTRHLNSRHTINALLKKNVIPIINENDTVSVDEIKLGDNDVLASLVAMLLEADALILLTTAEGFMITDERGKKIRLPHIVKMDEELLKHIESHKVGLSVGGMKSKVKAAINMNHVGGVAVIAAGQVKDVLYQIFEGENIGTVVGDINPNRTRRMPGRKRWIAFYHRAQGIIFVDDGAKTALLYKGKSLLPVGIFSTEGDFTKGSVVEIRDRDGECIAKGIIQVSSSELNSFISGTKEEKGAVLKEIKEVIHRDDMVIF